MRSSPPSSSNRVWAATRTLTPTESRNVVPDSALDREAYERNADDPAQHERYVEYRALLEDEPEWHDGEVEQDT